MFRAAESVSFEKVCIEQSSSQSYPCAWLWARFQNCRELPTSSWNLVFGGLSL
ncbi:hypothetical protein BaRGS_00026334, partial [Batillaria attramentaria]